MRSTARDLVSLVSTASGASLRHSPPAGEWTPALILVHLADAELVYAVRLRKVVAEHRPQLAAYDENAWAERFADLDDDPKDSLVRFRVLREATLALLDSIDAEEWKRVGIHEQRGDQTIEQIVVLLADHDRNHLTQLRQALSTA